MNTNNLNTALYEKMATEQEKYRDWLKSQPPEEILHHTYEYTVREDIVMAMEELELTDTQAQALLESPSPLVDVYRYFEKLETGYMDVIRDSIENRADDVCRAKEELRTTPIYPHSAAYAREHGELEQFFFIKEWLSDFLLCGSLLLIEVIQLGLCRLQTLGHLGESIVDTGKISARVCTKGCPVGHLSFQQERILLFPSGKFHGYGISPVAADLHRIGGFDLLAGIQKGCTGVLLIGQQVSTNLHTGKAVLRVRVSCQNLQVRFKALDKALVLFNLLREVFEQLVLQTILLALVVGFHQL